MAKTLSNNVPITPWGAPDIADNLGDGIILYSTPSHGGVYIPNELLECIPDAFFFSGNFAQQRRDGWFEEDCDMAIAIVFFPEHFRRVNIPAHFDTVWTPSVRALTHWHSEALTTALKGT